MFKNVLLRIFFELYLTKPQTGKKRQFIPKPEILVNAINKEENIIKEENGFWLNLNGIHEFIEYRDTYFLDNKTDNLHELITKYAQKTDVEIAKIAKLKTEIETLKKLIHNYSNRTVFEFYPLRNDIANLQKHELFTQIINILDLDKKIIDYENQVSTNKEYERAKTINEEIIKQENEYKDSIIKMNGLIEFLNINKQDEVQEKINKLNITLNELNNEIIKLQTDIRFNKLNIDLTNRINIAKDKEDEIKKQILEKTGKVEGAKVKIAELEERVKAAESEYAKADIECNLFDDNVDVIFLKDKYIQNPEDLQKLTLVECENAYNTHCNFLLKTYLNDIPNNKDITYQFLLNEILPSIFKNVKFEESSVIKMIEDYLIKINEQVKDINSVFIQMLTKLFQEVIDTYNEYKLKYDKIKSFFSQNEAKITGGHSVKLTFEPVDDFPLLFLENIKGVLNTQMTYTGGSSSIFHHIPKRNDIENIIIETYYEYGHKRDIKVSELLNPMNYFKMEFGIKSGNGNENKGSTGQKYAAIALLCIAQMSEIYKNKQNEPPKGIRFMPIDDAQDLGSNYDMLYSIADKEDFQIITFSIEPLNNLEISNQNWYMLQENPEEHQMNNPPFAMLSGVKDTIYEWETYLNTIYNE